MRKTLLFMATLCFFPVAAQESQVESIMSAQKPTIMVVPEKAWCLNNGYSQDGKAVDYEQVLHNTDILNVITAMGDIMAERGYPLKHLPSVLDGLRNNEAFDMVRQSKRGGNIVEDPLDELVRTANADILVNIAFDRKSIGPRQTIEFRVTSVDAATNKQIAGDVGHSSISAAPIISLLKESVLGFMDNFTTQISCHFNDIISNGREGTIIFKIAEDSPLNFESDVTMNGEKGELAEAIEYWLDENTIDGRYTVMEKSPATFSAEQVRFPLYGKGAFSKKSKAINAEGFIRPISSFLKQFGIQISTTPIGIGKVYVVLGSH